MRLTIETLKKMIRKELNESTAARVVSKVTRSNPGDLEMALLGALAVVAIGSLGAVVAKDVYRSYTVDYDELAQTLSEMPEEQIKIILKDWKNFKGDISRYDVPYSIRPGDEKKIRSDQRFITDIDRFSKQLASMSVEDLKQKLEMSQLRDLVMDYSAQLEDKPKPGEELALPKDTGSVYKESKKRQRVKRRRS